MVKYKTEKVIIDPNQPGLVRDEMERVMNNILDKGGVVCHIERIPSYRGQLEEFMIIYLDKERMIDDDD